MKNTYWKDIAELIGMTAIVLSLIFVRLQPRQSQQVAVEDVISYSNERQNAIRELIVANAEILQKACAGDFTLRAAGVRQSDESRQKIVEEFESSGVKPEMDTAWCGRT